jgi:hypothetical protein
LGHLRGLLHTQRVHVCVTIGHDDHATIARAHTRDLACASGHMALRAASVGTCVLPIAARALSSTGRVSLFGNFSLRIACCVFLAGVPLLLCRTVLEVPCRAMCDGMRVPYAPHSYRKNAASSPVWVYARHSVGVRPGAGAAWLRGWPGESRASSGPLRAGPIWRARSSSRAPAESFSGTSPWAHATSRQIAIDTSREWHTSQGPTEEVREHGTSFHPQKRQPVPTQT